MQLNKRRQKKENNKFQFQYANCKSFFACANLLAAGCSITEIQNVNNSNGTQKVKKGKTKQNSLQRNNKLTGT